MTDEEAAAPVPAEEAAAVPAEEAEAADTEPEMTLQEEFAELTPELRQAMFGKPAQQITGLLLGALVLVALLLGLSMLAKDGGAATGSPTSAASASAAP